MLLFNTWYYSFSPQLSTFMSTHTTDRSVFRAGLYPLVAALYASYYTYTLASSLGVEQATILAGLLAASLISLFYFAPIVLILDRLLRRNAGHVALCPRTAFTWLSASILMLAVSYSFGPQALAIATANLVLTTLTLTALLSPPLLASTLKFPCLTLQHYIISGNSSRMRLPLTSPGLKS